MTLAYIYGSGVDTLSNVMYKNTGKSYEEKFIRDMCFAVKLAFPKMFSKRIYFNSVARQTGKLQNPFGLILRFDNSTAHVAFNHLIQSTGACVMKLFIYFMSKRIQDIPWITPIIPNIHDASFSQIDEDRLDDATKLYQECLGDVNDLLIKNYGFKYPLRISFSSGKNFYDVKG
jgi:DNA polymerase I-like protein with 3'-5' exonuclease and polymerase domains